MIDLAQRSGPYEIALPYGLSVTVKPLTTTGMAAAQAAARRAVETVERQARERTEAGPHRALPAHGEDHRQARGEGSPWVAVLGARCEAAGDKAGRGLVSDHHIVALNRESKGRTKTRPVRSPQPTGPVNWTFGDGGYPHVWVHKNGGLLFGTAKESDNGDNGVQSIGSAVVDATHR
jgi:hypothetical protein